MSRPEEEVEGGESVEEEKEAQEEATGQKGEANRDLNRAMVQTEEKELDISKLEKAMNLIKASGNSDNKSDREKELEKVVIKKEDVDLIVNELEVARPVAERSLREHNGDLKQSLKALVNA